MLTVYNTLRNRKEPFQPIVPGKVRMYVCGMTVYDFCHLGHARVMVVFDMITRYLRFRGFDVTYVRNITDIDDKIIQRANENGESITELTARFIEAMNQDTEALGVLPPDQEPRATEHIDEIVTMIQKLVDNGYAYIAKNKDVYYDVSQFKGYGQLSGKRLDELRAGARVEIQEEKDDSLDFVLWKAAKPDEPNWDSPWGPAIISTSMAVVRISSSRTMKTKSPNQSVRQASLLSMSGYITDLSGLMRRRCRNHWETSLR
jgi:cysteinyl-tRNA synthetase